MDLILLPNYLLWILLHLLGRFNGGPYGGLYGRHPYGH